MVAPAAWAIGAPLTRDADSSQLIQPVAAHRTGRRDERPAGAGSSGPPVEPTRGGTVSQQLTAAHLAHLCSQALAASGDLARVLLA
jgi:hypothetical protein